MSKEPRKPRITGGETAMVRVPTAVSDGLTSARAGGEGWRVEVAMWKPPPSVFSVPPKATIWKVTPPEGTQLALPLDTKHPDPTHVRAFLSPMMLRVWLASLALAQAEQRNGRFPWQPTRLGTEFLGLPARADGGLRGGDGRDIKTAIRKLCQVGVQEIGGQRLRAGFQSLVMEWERVNDRVVTYEHASIVWRTIYGDFSDPDDPLLPDYAQMPLAALAHVRNDDASFAVGLTRCWRKHIIEAVFKPNAPGSYCAPLRTLLEELDIDVDAGVRDEGRAWWGRALARVQHATEAGDIGKVSWSETDPDAHTPVTLTPSPLLEASYRPLWEMIQTARAKAAQLPPKRRHRR